MSHYYAYTGSNEAKIDNPEEVKTFIEEVGEFATPRPRLVDDDKIVIEGETTFDFDRGEPEEFLSKLQPALEEPIAVRSVGFWLDDREIPSVTQWVAEPGQDGEVVVQQLPHPKVADDFSIDSTPFETGGGESSEAAD